MDNNIKITQKFAATVFKVDQATISLYRSDMNMNMNKVVINSNEGGKWKVFNQKETINIKPKKERSRVIYYEIEDNN